MSDFIKNAKEELKELDKQTEKEDAEILDLLLNTHGKSDKTITVKISEIDLKVFRNIPRHIEEKIHEYRKERYEYGSDYVGETLDEDKRPLFIILAGLCAEEPYNKPSLWEAYDKKSDGMASAFFEDVMEAIGKYKKKITRFR
jgi:hypothetical protein